MRLRNLRLERYGSFESHELDLPTSAGLIVVHGANAAGKSTFLAAISDFLFGIPDRTPHGQRFGYEQMRIVGTIELADGKTQILCRRKARGPRSLTNDQGASVDEAVLGGLLGGISRQKFSALFGLDHASLRVGGESLLAAEGDIGRLIVEAGGGLRSLVTRLRDIETEAAGLFTSRKSADRAFYKASEAFIVADKSMRQASVSFETYRAADQELDDRTNALEELKARRLQGRESVFVAQRLVRAAPIIVELDACSARLREFADVQNVDPGMSLRIERAWESHTSAKSDADDAAAEVARLTLERGAVVLDEPLLAHAQTITTIGIKAIHVSREHEHRAKREGELQASILKLQALRSLVGVDDIEQLKSLAPTALEIDRIQELAGQAIAEASQLANAVDEIEEIGREIEQARRAQEDLSKRGLDKPLLVKEAEFARIVSLDAEVRKLEKDISSRLSSFTASCAADGYHSADDARAMLWPDAATVEAEKKAREELARESDSTRASRNEAEASVRRAIRSLERTRKQGELPTVAAIDSARTVRDGAWGRLRALVLDESAKAWEAADLDARTEEIATFEKAKFSADYLSDRKSEEADRIAEARRAEQDKDEYAAKIDALDARLKVLSTELEARETAWQVAWPLATARTADLNVLRQLVGRRDNLMEIADDLLDRQEKLATASNDLHLAKAALTVAEDRLDLADREGLSLKRRVEDVSAAVANHAEGHSDFRTSVTLLEKHEARLLQREGEREQLERSKADRAVEWRATMPKLGMDADARPQLAMQAANLWVAAGGVFGEIAITKRRLQAMDEDEGELRDLVLQVARDLDLELGADPVGAAEILVARRRAAEEAKSEYAALNKQLKAAEGLVGRKREALGLVEAEVDAICSSLNCPRDELVALGQRRAAATEVEAEWKELEKRLRVASDGHSLDSLRDQINNRSFDALKVDGAEAESLLEQVETEHEAAIRSLQEAEKVLAAITSAESVGTAVADREAAAAELEAISSRYVHLRVAKALLEAAIERVRNHQQSPLVARAEELFSACTRGAFTGIEADVDEKGSPIVVGRRQDGEIVRVGVMSDGERDQLYLAFRLAAIEHYGEAAEALPFIADDVLIHFDDPRSVASLEILATFAQSTQVILFTHHDSVLEAAKKLEGRGEAVVVRLP